MAEPLLGEPVDVEFDVDTGLSWAEVEVMTDEMSGFAIEDYAVWLRAQVTGLGKDGMVVLAVGGAVILTAR